MYCLEGEKEFVRKKSREEETVIPLEIIALIVGIQIMINGDSV